MNEQCNACDLTSPRLFEQTAARYNNEAADNLSAARQNFLMQQQANWMTLMQKIQNPNIFVAPAPNNIQP